MISANMRNYDYYLYGDVDAYGQPALSDKQGTIKMAIHVSSQRVQDNILYSGAEYVGLTHDELSDKYVIQYGEARLKVLYVNPQGRYKQVFLTRM